jgi:TRAP-type C4-dicarboxylate transport system permease large subunit
MEMGQITPPIGVNVFAICSVAQDVPMQETFKGIAPFFLCMVLTVVLLLIFPRLATYLPGLFY